MGNSHNIIDSMQRLDTLCTSGYAIALHISYTTPRFLFQTYNPGWMDIYAEKGLVMKDPTVLWGFDNTGVARWRDLEDNDEHNVLPMAREYGLVYGFTFAQIENSSRSISSFARFDRDFSDAEIDEIPTIASNLHRLTADIKEISDDALKELKKLSVIYTRG